MAGSSARPCHYAMLGVARDASAADIRSAYRQLVLRWHPDKVQVQGDDPREKEEAAARFRQIHQAYEVLSDASRRAAYDAVAFRPVRDRAKNAFPSRSTMNDELTRDLARSLGKMKELVERMKQEPKPTREELIALMKEMQDAGPTAAARNAVLRGRQSAASSPASSSTSTSCRYCPFSRKG
ncbi:hypothetical protein SETIT_4G264200v2 [Setaria italica]|uniref:J domain-containing protein n=1 Tax=Setaria italica TaxID=4555 RepID=K3Y1J9_SETIT|nr:dnaJ homolog subfamily B member 3 [Setaria italica]RCV22992.1 hypothetical protein SETIT_4G264200v2 [Setaria italica]